MARSLILASSSPRRRQLLAEAGYGFTVLPSEAEESWNLERGLSELVKKNALAKAKWVAKQQAEAIVIGADTLVAIDGEALGKPKDMKAAREMIGRLSGRTHEVTTGVALCCDEMGESLLFDVTTRVTFKVLSAQRIEDYFAEVNPLDKAGAYGAQEHGQDIIDLIDGSWSNVVGLPMEAFEAHLEKFDQRLEEAERR